ncbi:hypothetical protein GCM10010339_26430 [Streptomyces alanosinicus]|uniref:Uncharacterized protein n=1 Tax=Streptomyces alanosinicus TaxID=68171 RepID=A0A918YGV0_9ACTN|nr:hypothetical protein GCM10010339_26430 [Streptomyces alanosinicus]
MPLPPERLDLVEDGRHYAVHLDDFELTTWPDTPPKDRGDTYFGDIFEPNQDWLLCTGASRAATLVTDIPRLDGGHVPLSSDSYSVASILDVTGHRGCDDRGHRRQI